MAEEPFIKEKSPKMSKPDFGLKSGLPLSFNRRYILISSSLADKKWNSVRLYEGTDLILMR